MTLLCTVDKAVDLRSALFEALKTDPKNIKDKDWYFDEYRPNLMLQVQELITNSSEQADHELILKVCILHQQPKDDYQPSVAYQLARAVDKASCEYKTEEEYKLRTEVWQAGTNTLSDLYRRGEHISFIYRQLYSISHELGQEIQVKIGDEAMVLKPDDEFDEPENYWYNSSFTC